MERREYYKLQYNIPHEVFFLNSLLAKKLKSLNLLLSTQIFKHNSKCSMEGICFKNKKKLDIYHFIF